jgi:hypothetical protein
MTKRDNALLAERSPPHQPLSAATAAVPPVPAFSVTEAGDVRVVMPRSRLPARESGVLAKLRGVFAQALADASTEGAIATYLKRRQTLLETRGQLATAVANERDLRQRHGAGLDKGEPVDKTER